jgi:hypothetical protein
MEINIDNILIVFYSILLIFYKFGKSKVLDELFIDLTYYLYINGFIQTAFSFSDSLKIKSNCNPNLKDCTKAYKIYSIIKNNNKELLDEYFNSETQLVELEDLFIIQYSIYQNWGENLWNSVNHNIANTKISVLKSEPSLYETYKEIYKDCNKSYRDCSAAYKKVSLKYHPDKHPVDPEKKYIKLFQSLRTNYDMLMKLNYNTDI